MGGGSACYRCCCVQGTSEPASGRTHGSSECTAAPVGAGADRDRSWSEGDSVVRTALCVADGRGVGRGDARHRRPPAGDGAAEACLRITGRLRLRGRNAGRRRRLCRKPRRWQLHYMSSRRTQAAGHRTCEAPGTRAPIIATGTAGGGGASTHLGRARATRERDGGSEGPPGPRCWFRRCCRIAQIARLLAGDRMRCRAAVRAALTMRSKGG